MTDIGNIASTLTTFLLQPDKDWSVASYQFFAVFIIFYIIYIGVCRSRRSVVLSYVIIFSLFFAWKANGLMMLLLPATTVISWWGTRAMMRARSHRRLWLTAIILIDLAPLIYFKYTNFLLSVFGGMLQRNFAPLDIILPVGLSFYTFQAISYSVDVYKWRFTRETPLLYYAFYLTFFPLLLAGPITRAEVLIPQISVFSSQNAAMKPRTSNLAYKGLWLIMAGLIKKAVIADYIAQFNNLVFADPTAYSGFENLMATLGFTLQIFCDFSGYSDISIGLAALMGFDLHDNFNFPYQSLNPTEFWHRWHIALSTWFRDYMYIPLGGNRHGLARTCINGFLTMVVAGLWHGATWMFVLWGSLHGLALVVHKICKRLFLDRIPDTLMVRMVSWAMMFSFVCITWIFFRADSITTATGIIGRIANGISSADIIAFLNARPLWMLLTALGLELHSIRREDYDWLERKFIGLPWLVKFVCFLAVIQLVISFSQQYVQPFIYTKF